MNHELYYHYFRSELTESIKTKQQVLDSEVLSHVFVEASLACIHALKNGNKILFAGNGGSAADAQHLAAEFVSRFYFDRPALSAIALTTDTSILTAIGNDYGYEYIFSRQLEAIARSGDVFIAISTSGNSLNILNAIEKARDLGLTIIAFTSIRDTKMIKNSDFYFNIPSNNTARIQESHIMIGHMMCGLIEKSIFSNESP
jgi:D-sedoheptulose 7-phosphate isomerase